jgi:hypothetical protein
VRTIVAPAGLEDGVGRGGEVGAAVADQESDVLEPRAGVHGQVAGLLDGPRAGGVRGDATQVHPAGAVLDEYQHVQPCQQHRVNVQEIDGQDSRGLRVQELPPRRARASRCRIDARSTQDFKDGRRRGGGAGLGQLAVIRR